MTIEGVLILVIVIGLLMKAFERGNDEAED
jgi:hypothetical protein